MSLDLSFGTSKTKAYTRNGARTVYVWHPFHSALPCQHSILTYTLNRLDNFYCAFKPNKHKKVFPLQLLFLPFRHLIDIFPI